MSGVISTVKKTKQGRDLKSDGREGVAILGWVMEEDHPEWVTLKQGCERVRD